MNGRAWCYAGVLDVDREICSIEIVRQLQAEGIMTTDEELGRYCMREVDPNFASSVVVGDFLVGDEGFGYGHDHDHACQSIRGAGVAAVLCESAAPYFLRNSFNHGLPVLEVPGVFAQVTTGDELEVNLEAGVVRNLRSGWVGSFERLPAFVHRLIVGGGVYGVLEEEARQARAEGQAVR